MRNELRDAEHERDHPHKDRQLSESDVTFRGIAILVILFLLTAVAFLVIQSGFPALAKHSSLTDWLLVSLTLGYVFVSFRMLRAIADQVALSRQTAERQLRAYVGYDGGTVNLEPNNPMVTIRLKNFGLTPAYKFVYWADMKLVDSEDDLPALDTTQETGRHNLPPGAVHFAHLATDQALSEHERWDIEHDIGQKLFVYGKARYRDAFGMRRYVTYRLRVRVIQTGPNQLSATLYLCDRGNKSN